MFHEAMKNKTESLPFAWIIAAVSAFVFAVTLGLIRLGGNMSTVFGPIDDHEPASWIGNRGRLPLSDYLPTLFSKTEIGQFGDSPRFRPSYFAIRVFEAVVLGDSSTAWYAMVGVVYVATIVIFSFVTWLWLQRALNLSQPKWSVGLAIVAPMLGVLLFGSMNPWIGVSARLGPSELWASLGFALALLGTTQLVFSASAWWWAPTLLGSGLATMAKENYLPLAAAVAVTGIWRFIEYRKKLDVVLVFLSLLPSLVVGIAIFSYTGVSGSDVYGNEVGTSRLSSAFSLLFNTLILYWLPAVALLIGALVALSALTPSGLASRVILAWVLLAIGLIWLFFDAVVYDGVFVLPRYEMVFYTLKLLALIAALALGIFAARHASNLTSRVFTLSVVAGCLAIVLSQLIAVPDSALRMRDEVEANRLAVQNWQDGLSEVQRLIDLSQRESVLVVVDRGVDLEPTVALLQDIYEFEPEIDAYVSLGPNLDAGSGPGMFISGLGQNQLEGLNGNPNVCIFLNTEVNESFGCSSQSSVSVFARGM
jgi:hypothetical protein